METLELGLMQSEKGFLGGGGRGEQKGRERRQGSCPACGHSPTSRKKLCLW